MGWCSGTVIFDVVAEAVLSEKPINKQAVIEVLIAALEDGDWDCQSESAYWDHPVVRAAFMKSSPHWFEDDDE